MVDWKTRKSRMVQNPVTRGFWHSEDSVLTSEAEAEVKKAHDSGFEFGKEYRDKMGEDG